MIKTKKQTGSVPQIGIALLLVAMIVLCIDPACREFLRNFAVVVGAFGVWHAKKMLK